MIKQRKCYLFIIFLILLISLLYGDEQNPEPEDPGIVLPEVLLEIEDLSIESIEASLPEGDELLPLEREAPLPPEEEISIKEPGVELMLPDSEMTISSTEEPSYITEIIVGAGNVNNVIGQISFYKLGIEPIIKLLYRHETLDGFAFKSVGLGYMQREDILEGALKFHLGDLALQLEALYQEEERGLQEQVDYFSLINRFIDGNLTLSYSPADFFTLSGMIASDLSSFHLTGADTPSYDVDYPPNELLLESVLKGELHWESFNIGLKARYKYRNIFGDSEYELHRLRADLEAGLEFPAWINAQAAVGVFYSNESDFLIPFSVYLYGFPIDWLTIRLGGGYRIEECDLLYILSNFSYVDLPAHLYDNHGWFGNISAQIGMENILIFIADLTLSTNSHFFLEQDNYNTLTGLFPVEVNNDVLLLSAELRLRLNLASWFYLNMINKLNYPLSGAINPEDEFSFEAVAAQEDGIYGATLALTLETDFQDLSLLPQLDLGLFYRVWDNVKFIIEAEDLLWPLGTEDRYLLKPYLAPGIRGRFKVQINF